MPIIRKIWGDILGDILGYDNLYTLYKNNAHGEMVKRNIENINMVSNIWGLLVLDCMYFISHFNILTNYAIML